MCLCVYAYGGRVDSKAAEAGLELPKYLEISVTCLIGSGTPLPLSHTTAQLYRQLQSNNEENLHELQFGSILKMYLTKTPEKCQDH